MTLKKGALIIPVIVAIVILGFPTAYVANKTINNPRLIRPHSHQTNPNAKIKIVTFVDYECPPCVDVHETTKKIIEKHPKDVNLVIRHRLGEGHDNAELAASAAEAAAEQGKFWQMNDKLLENQQEWASQENPQDSFIRYASELGLGIDQYTQDFLSEKYAQVIKTDEKDANGLGVETIPTTFLNGQNMGYAPTEEELDRQIAFLKMELENIETDPDYRDPTFEENLIKIAVFAGAPLIIIIGGLIVLGRIKELRKRAKDIRKRIDELESKKKKP